MPFDGAACRANAVQIIDLMTTLFRDGERWTRGEMHDGRGGGVWWEPCATSGRR
jgi:hypothetical protein